MRHSKYLLPFFGVGAAISVLYTLQQHETSNIELSVHDYDTARINKISIASAHSCIKIGYQDTDTDVITVSYEQPDWLEYEIAANGSMLSFHEVSNGRLPFFRFDTLHESRTLIKVLLPKGYNPEIVQLESRGGFITVRGLAENIKVKTYTGKIYYYEQDETTNLEVLAETGIINISGDTISNQTEGGLEYYNHIDSDKTVELTSTRGDIYTQ